MAELPEDWAGLFWPREHSAHLIFELTPEAFIDRMVQEGSGDGSAPYLVAGALFDLFLCNSDEDGRRTLLLQTAQERWPDHPWDIIESLARFTAFRIKAEADVDMEDVAIRNVGLFTYLFEIPRTNRSHEFEVTLRGALPRVAETLAAAAAAEADDLPAT